MRIGRACMAEKHPAAAPGFFGLVLQRRRLERPRVRLLLLVAGCVGIPLWQRSFAVRPERMDRRYALRASSGLQYPGGIQTPTKFVYFFTYLGLYPVATELDESRLVMSRAGAEQVLREHGDTLIMETGHTIRSGQHGRIYVYLPDAWLKGAPRAPSVRACHGIVFVLALEALFVAFWWARRTLLGILLVAFLGSNPFQLLEVYGRENIFGWPITTAAIVLALHVPFLFGERRPGRLATWGAPVATGLLLATVRQVRPEPVVLILSALGLYATASALRWRVRLALVALLAASFGGASKAWEAHFARKYDQALEVVTAAGGHPYTGPRMGYNTPWDNIWEGLGDFDTKYGYAWSDAAAVAHARPVLLEKYGEEVAGDGYWDDAKKYYKWPLETPHYNDVLRSKVLRDITHDPLWYLGILAQRAWRILTQTTPLRLAWGTVWVSLPMHGLLALPVLCLLAWARAWGLLKLVGFFVPLSLVALLVYSGKGMCYYSCYHVGVAAVVCALLFEGVLWAYKWWRRQRRPS